MDDLPIKQAPSDQHRWILSVKLTPHTLFTVWGTTINHTTLNIVNKETGLSPVKTPALCSIVSTVYSWELAKQELKMHQHFFFLRTRPLCSHKSTNSSFATSFGFGCFWLVSCIWVFLFEENELEAPSYKKRGGEKETRTHTHIHTQENATR